MDFIFTYVSQTAKSVKILSRKNFPLFPTISHMHQNKLCINEACAFCRLREIKEEFGRFDRITSDMLSMVKKVNSPVVFCHNDLLCGNILYNGEYQHYRHDQLYVLALVQTMISEVY